ncbi:histidine ammonia-lyase [Clostridium sp. BJN0001]|uniref:histidine ammonia-lyase n=1 Tax=Clostridium sp. BJN0001 TaxID=2930219 RepID=UPI001FD23D44|nr:histidine ammonia-lyase [Clostridium sp. BJN0001]
MYIDVKNIKEVELTGSGLTVEKVVAIARYGARVSISDQAIKNMSKSRDLVEKIVEDGRAAYGVSTGFGEFSKVSIDKDMIEVLQENLILSHCTAVGNPYKQEVVRAMMVLRCNALSIGYSGIRPEVVLKLVEMLNKGVTPVVPEKGSLGASGDLAPLAHMALVLIGKGEAYYKNERLDGLEAMNRAEITPVKLKAKEGLALINGTQAMNAVGTLSYYDSLNAARLADITAAMTMEALTALDNAFDERVQRVRPHAGQNYVAKNIRMLINGSKIIENSRDLRVQDAYAIRCIPQVHGAIRDTLDYARKVIETEMNSVTDNPILFTEDEAVISGGNFHGEPLALVFDYLGIAVSELANISERRLERLVNPALSEGLPAFLTRHGGINSGYMICQYCAASMVSENKVLAHPASVDSIPSSANQEDHVSMGTTAARKSRNIVENALSVLAFELMAAVQGVDLRGGEISPINKSVYDLVREEVPTLDKDREIRLDITKMNNLVRSELIQKTVMEKCEQFR